MKWTMNPLEYQQIANASYCKFQLEFWMQVSQQNNLNIRKTSYHYSSHNWCQAPHIRLNNGRMCSLLIFFEVSGWNLASGNTVLYIKWQKCRRDWFYKYSKLKNMVSSSSPPYILHPSPFFIFCCNPILPWILMYPIPLKKCPSI